MNAQSRLGRGLMGALKALIAAAMLYLLVYFKLVDLSVLASFRHHIGTAIVVMIVVFLSYVTASLRWWLLFRVQGFQTSFRQVFNANYVGTFSLVFVPGAGGEAVRMMLAMRLAASERARAALTVFGDRVMAIMTLSIWAAGATAAKWSTLPAAMRPLGLAMIAAPVVIILASLMMMQIAARLELRRPVHAGAARRRLLLLAHSIIDFLAILRSNPRGAMCTIAASFITTGLVLSNILMVAHAYALPRLTLGDYLFAAPVAMVINTIPLSPGGIGVGEAAFDRVCNWLAEPGDPIPYGTIYLTYRILAIIVAVYGVVPLLNVRRLAAQAAEG
jgi:uncharacterized membrane protein YbhN (UPF0104 family)